MIDPDLSRLIDSTTAAAGAEWREEATGIVTTLARTRAEFTADDVWLAGLSKPREGRALGGVMTAAKRAGLIERTSRYVTSVLPGYHANPRVVWRSTVFEKVAA